ncbi:hypothetical protein ACFPN2_25205 [Steroidobacter flavus]|uniref:Uncharacterized protein n=1 Tax=Steroidobacter flavus TaxID=1842136 RepID=A0ABV8SXR3_9GAMM
MLNGLSRQLRRLLKETTRPNLRQRSRLLIKLGAQIHATSVDRSDGCAIAILDHCGVVRAWHDSLPGATAFDLRIIGAHVLQFYLPHDVALLRPDRDLLAARLHGSTTQHRWHRRPNGSIFWAVTVIEPIYLENGELNGYSHVTRLAHDPRGRPPAEIRDAPRQFSSFQGAIAAA